MHDRLIDLERVLNFRDFGGYDTAGGGKLARGKLFRSAAFHDATEADIARLEALGVRFLVDLRRPEKRDHEPNRWPGETCRTVFNDEGRGAALPPHILALMQEEITAESIAGFMRRIYREFAFEARHIALYRAWFEGLLKEDGAGVIHCAAGKDRTGLGCALTLLALGVDEDAVFADYEFTNQAVDIEARMPRILDSMERRLDRKFDPDALRPMLGVAPDYLRGALDSIEAKHGSIEAYLEDVLGVGENARAELRQRFTV